MLERSEAARRSRLDIEDWLGGRGSIAVTALLVCLVIALVLGLARV